MQLHIHFDKISKLGITATLRIIPFLVITLPQAIAETYV